MFILLVTVEIRTETRITGYPTVLVVLQSTA